MRRGLLPLAAALLALLAGCVAIPDSGAVQTQEIASDGTDDALLSIPDGPVPGATPAEIVRGFLLAGRGPQNGYTVARQFLTDDFRFEWSSAGALVTSSAFSPVVEGGGTATVSVTVAAEVDASGHYTTADAGSERQLPFALELDADGEWRISSAPDGTVVPPSTFETIYQPYSLYYFDPDYRFLVPDLRWFLRTGSPPTRIVAQLLAADSTLLSSGALVSAFPSGAELTGDGVTVDGGRAVVSLGSAVSAQPGRDQWRMLQQLTASLVQLPDVREVAVTVGGLPLAIPDLGDDADRFLTVPGSPAGLSDGAFGLLADTGVTRIDGIGTTVDGLDARGAALGREADSAAVLAAQGVFRVAGGEATLLDTRDGLAVPALDPLGFVWSVPAADPSGLLVVGEDGLASPVANDLSGRIVAFRLARDGTRALVALQAADGPHLVLAGVARDGDRVPTALVESVELPFAGDSLLDAVWADGGTVAVLGTEDGRLIVEALVLGGRTTRLGSPEDGVQLVAGNGVDVLRLRTSDGSVLRSSGVAGWTDTGIDASFLAVSG